MVWWEERAEIVRRIVQVKFYDMMFGLGGIHLLYGHGNLPLNSLKKRIQKNSPPLLVPVLNFIDDTLIIDFVIDSSN